MKRQLRALRCFKHSVFSLFCFTSHLKHMSNAEAEDSWQWIILPQSINGQGLAQKEVNILFVYHYLIGVCSSLLNYELYGWCGQQERLVLGLWASTWSLLWSSCVSVFFFSQPFRLMQILTLTFLLSWEIMHYGGVKERMAGNYITL